MFNSGKQDPIVLSQYRETSEFGWLQQSTVKEVLLFASREVIKRTSSGNLNFY